MKTINQLIIYHKKLCNQLVIDFQYKSINLYWLVSTIDLIYLTHQETQKIPRHWSNMIQINIHVQQLDFSDHGLNFLKTLTLHILKHHWEHYEREAASHHSDHHSVVTHMAALGEAQSNLLLGLCQRFLFFGGVEMLIGWMCSRDLFETSWEGLHKVLLIVIAEESRMFTCVLSLSQWRCCHNFEPLISHTNIHARCGRSWQTFLEWFWLRWFSLLCTYWGQVYWHNASHAIVELQKSVSNAHNLLGPVHGVSENGNYIFLFVLSAYISQHCSSLLLLSCPTTVEHVLNWGA